MRPSGSTRFSYGGRSGVRVYARVWGGGEVEMLEMRDLLPFLHLGEARDLVALAVGPGLGRVAAVCAQYEADPTWQIRGAYRDGRLVGCLGLELLGQDRARIRHIAVVALHRREGIGREMIGEAQQRQGLAQLIAETDGEAVEFYRALGFTVRGLGSIDPAIERFRCELTVVR